MRSCWRLFYLNPSWWSEVHEGSKNHALNNAQCRYQNERDRGQFEGHGASGRKSRCASHCRDSGKNAERTCRRGGSWGAAEVILTCGLGCAGVVSCSLWRGRCPCSPFAHGRNWKLQYYKRIQNRYMAYEACTRSQIPRYYLNNQSRIVISEDRADKTSPLQLSPRTPPIVIEAGWCSSCAPTKRAHRNPMRKLTRYLENIEVTGMKIGLSSSLIVRINRVSFGDM